MDIEEIYDELGYELSKITSQSMMESASPMNVILGTECRSDKKSFKKGRFNTLSKSATSMEDYHDNAELQPIKYNFEGKIRKIFNKKPKIGEERKIGCHPDFRHLEKKSSYPMTEKGYAITLFMDIIGSTKLGVTYEPEIVYAIKNNVIRCAIETINSFDGHVHRIMGDAVMAFFRSKDSKNHMDSAIDAINCATYLIQMIEKLVQPKLAAHLHGEDIGIRIGLDYGRDEEILWGYYGEGLINEITATSFFVDVAAKLQQKAPRNSIMIGESLRELLSLDKLHNHVKEKDNEQFLTPNYMDANGDKINYRQYIFNAEDYQTRLPKEKTNSSLTVTIKVRDDKLSPNGEDYIPCSKSVLKNKHLKFKATYNPQRKMISGSELFFKFDVYNTGDEARNADAQNLDNHSTKVKAALELDNGEFTAQHYEHASYKGLHKLVVSVISNGYVIESSEHSIFIY